MESYGRVSIHRSITRTELVLRNYYIRYQNDCGDGFRSFMDVDLKNDHFIMRGSIQSVSASHLFHMH